MLFKTKVSKIFCLSFQRTGTTSVGQFFKDFGYKVAGYDSHRSSDWSVKRFLGDYESIFKSKDFKNHQVFEDNPWWETDFYKVLYHRFPDAKFILFTRDADKWFDSMVSHFNAVSPGSLFTAQLEDTDKWKRLAAFFNIDLPVNYQVHVNKSK